MAYLKVGDWMGRLPRVPNMEPPLMISKRNPFPEADFLEREEPEQKYDIASLKDASNLNMTSSIPNYLSFDMGDMDRRYE